MTHDVLGVGAGLETAEEGLVPRVGAVGVAEQGNHAVALDRRQFRAACVEGDEGGVAVSEGKMVVVVEMDPHRGRMRRHQCDGALHAGNASRVGGRERQDFRVGWDGEVSPHPIPGGEGDAVKAAVADHVDPLRRGFDALEVVAVVGTPQLPGHWVQGHAEDIADTRGEDAPPAAVDVELQDRTPLRVGSPAQVAGPADAEIHLAALLVDDDGAGGMGAAGGNAVDKDFALFVDEVAV